MTNDLDEMKSDFDRTMERFEACGKLLNEVDRMADEHIDHWGNIGLSIILFGLLPSVLMLLVLSFVLSPVFFVLGGVGAVVSVLGLIYSDRKMGQWRVYFDQYDFMCK